MLSNGFNPRKMIPENKCEKKGGSAASVWRLPVPSLVEQVVLERGRQGQSMDFTQSLSS